jgi:heme/copper-type cytochrome/quinol oxidase subunit 2
MAGIGEQGERTGDDPAPKLDEHEPARQERRYADAGCVILVATMVVIVCVVMVVVMRRRRRMRVTAEGMIVSHDLPLGSAGAEIK